MWVRGIAQLVTRWAAPFVLDFRQRARTTTLAPTYARWLGAGSIPARARLRMAVSTIS